LRKNLNSQIGMESQEEPPPAMQKGEKKRDDREARFARASLLLSSLVARQLRRLAWLEL